MHIAIVEDNQAVRQQIESCLHRFSEETGEKLTLSVFEDGLDIVEKYEPKFDRNSPAEKILSYICSSQSRKCPCCGKGNLTYVTSNRELRIMGDSCGIRPRGIDKPSPKSRSA